MRYCRKGIHFHVLRFKEGSFMISFIVCLALLITGYLTYGKIVDNTFGPDDRETLRSASTTA